MKTKKSMKNKMAELAAIAVMTAMGATSAFAQADRSGDGGHGMEAQFSGMATNIYSWVKIAKQEGTLNEAIQMTDAEADTVMRKFESLTLPGHIQFVTTELKVLDTATGTMSSPRVCLPEGEIIKCNQTMWASQSITQDYYTVFHEVLASSGLEPNVGELSNYRFSKNLFALVPKLNSAGGIVNRATGEKIELVKIDNTKLLFTLSIAGTVEPISPIFSTKSISNLVANPKQYMDQAEYVEPFVLTSTMYGDNGIFQEYSPTNGESAAVVATILTAFAGPTALDLVLLPVIGGIDLTQALVHQHRANKIRQTLSRSLRSGANTEIVVKSKVFNLVKNAVSRIQ